MGSGAENLPCRIFLHAGSCTGHQSARGPRDPEVDEGKRLAGLAPVGAATLITLDLLIVCIRAVNKGNYLAIFLFGAAGPILLFGILGQPTNLGFAAFGGGLCLAAALSHKS